MHVNVHVHVPMFESVRFWFWCAILFAHCYSCVYWLTVGERFCPAAQCTNTRFLCSNTYGVGKRGGKIIARAKKEARRRARHQPPRSSRVYVHTQTNMDLFLERRSHSKNPSNLMRVVMRSNTLHVVLQTLDHAHCVHFELTC